MTRRGIVVASLVVGLAPTLLAGCQPAGKSEAPSAELAPDTLADRPQDGADPPADEERSAVHESSLPQKGSYAPPSAYPMQVYFGDPHVHTSISLDAAAWGNRLGPEGAYRFARGEAVTSFKGWTAKLTRPLDFVVVADHTDGYGFYTRIEAGDPFVVSKPEGKRWHELLKEGDNRTVSDEIIKMFSQGTLPWDITSKEMLGPGWEETIAAAEKYNDPGKFTAFIGYEWTSLPNGNNVHQFFTGMRIGETCGRRWRDWSSDAKPLGVLRVHTQYADQPLKTAKSGDSKERMVPVHPELEKVLWCWQGEGFQAVYGRPPGPDDFIVPDPRKMAARTQSQATKAHKRDAELIGVPNKGSHALRRFMISAARSSGARSDVLEQITHNARGAIIDVYTAWEWPALCEAVSCLKVDPERLPGRIYDISYDICVSQNANPRQSLRLFGGGGGNRTLLSAIR